LETILLGKIPSGRKKVVGEEEREQAKTNQSAALRPGVEENQVKNSLKGG